MMVDGITHTCVLYENKNTLILTLPMDSAMDSTMPPTMPPSLAASFKVTMMSSTASFISWAASDMASWVWDACGHSQLIDIFITLSWSSHKETYQLDNRSRVSLQLVSTQCVTKGHFTRLDFCCYQNFTLYFLMIQSQVKRFTKGLLKIREL